MKISGSQKSSPGGNHALQTRDLHLWQLQHQHHWRMGFSHHITTKAKSALFLGVGCTKIIFLNDDTLIYYSIKIIFLNDNTLIYYSTLLENRQKGSQQQPRIQNSQTK